MKPATEAAAAKALRSAVRRESRLTREILELEQHLTGLKEKLDATQSEITELRSELSDSAAFDKNGEAVKA